ncbi:hypothetical protein LX15_005257 [Streptoalloteichus tenebrarius]|uniref:Outer membrane channel protein CpnT-like N-terminal domain-containing protein n=1 Tax=Streptoalloteichus tenebrarius (strain ATCC 17920 / DSM 40477 / JCM 4838 / CBS 697.72 / NBRC 16177 / NCIMB 11028 / NRRL B-12390 / A12253. 1 / ISP 5477) TaxID=1933 RepID=A0ABT1I160_STRSD|nr:hypothetical protein [Streptoalloteichus tenebrarius]MCP2261531.1 hypothetical protein [Streptoalloteichus tenebrarius]BFE99309.1 hypothetical protein GCM10020241_09850 [Streptoalloteichus tenebrarius]
MGLDQRTGNPLVDDKSFVGGNYTFDPRQPLANVGLPTGGQNADGTEGSTGVMTGFTAFEAGWTLAQGIDKGDWTLAAAGAAGVALDAFSAATDPIGYVAGQLFSWMLEHVEPARAALHALSGNPDMVRGYAASWTNIEKEMTAVGTEYRGVAEQTRGFWEGAAGDGYRARAGRIADLCHGAAGGAHGVAALTLGMAEVVGGVRTAVRDLLSTLAGTLVSAAIELGATVGLAAPVVVGQVTSKIAQVVRIVGELMTALGKTLKSATTWLVELRDLFEGFWRSIRALRENTGPAAA